MKKKELAKITSRYCIDNEEGYVLYTTPKNEEAITEGFEDVVVFNGWEPENPNRFYQLRTFRTEEDALDNWRLVEPYIGTKVDYEVMELNEAIARLKAS